MRDADTRAGWPRHRGGMRASQTRCALALALVLAAAGCAGNATLEPSLSASRADATPTPTPALPSPTAPPEVLEWQPAVVEDAPAGWEFTRVKAVPNGFIAVAVANSGRTTALWSSADGLRWSRLTAEDAPAAGILDVASTALMGSLPALTAVGSSPQRAAMTWTSNDGRVWAPAAFPEPAASLRWIAASPNVILAGGSIGSDGAIWWSTDAVSWNRARLPSAKGYFTPGAQDGSPAMVRGANLSWSGPGKDGWTAFGDVPPPPDGAGFPVSVIWSSFDGRSWTRLPDRHGPRSESIFDVWAREEGRYVAAGTADWHPVAWWSEDFGETWQPYDVPAGLGEIDEIVPSESGVIGLGIVAAAAVLQEPLAAVVWNLGGSDPTRQDLSDAVAGLPSSLAPSVDGAYVVVGRAWPDETGSWDAPYEPGAWVWTPTLH